MELPIWKETFEGVKYLSWINKVCLIRGKNEVLKLLKGEYDPYKVNFTSRIEKPLNLTGDIYWYVEF